jgi:hypothetical protein
MGKRHAAIAMDALGRAVEALQTLKPEEMSAGDIIRYIEVGVKLERLARGTPEDLPAGEEQQTPQQRIRELLGSDPAVAKAAAAALNAQILRVQREREQDA